MGRILGKPRDKSWDASAMRNAIEAVKNRQMGWLKASKIFGVPFTTLRRRVLGTNKKFKDNTKGLDRFHTTFTKEQEELVAQRGSTRQVKKRLQIDPDDAFEQDIKFQAEDDDEDEFCLFCTKPFLQSKAGE